MQKHRSTCPFAYSLSKLTLMRSHSGFTLVELMISVGLFSVFSLALASLFADFTKQTVTAYNRADLSEEHQLFNLNMDLFLTNMTRLIECNCGEDNCRIHTDWDEAALDSVDCMDSATTCGTTTDSTLVLDFETESANNPAQVASSSCLDGGTLGNTRGVDDTNGGLIRRGCKRRMQIRWIAPTQNTIVGTTETIGTPGRIQIWDATQASNPVLLHQLRGAFRLVCGFLDDGSDNTVNDAAAVVDRSQFRIDYGVKRQTIRTDTRTTGSDTLIESWHPGDASAFSLGFHSRRSRTVPLRNLNSPGIHYGLPLTFESCTPAGQVDSSGNCCSGHFNVLSNLCLPQQMGDGNTTGCLARGQPPVSTDIAGILSCCSHKTGDDGTGNRICL